jgi:hypothetical protein
LILCGFLGQQKTAFDELTVHRINIVEPDGTPRMILSSEDARPGSFFKGKQHARPDLKGAGVYFYNNEETEAGGVIYSSFMDKDGKIGEATDSCLLRRQRSLSNRGERLGLPVALRGTRLGFSTNSELKSLESANWDTAMTCLEGTRGFQLARRNQDLLRFAVVVGFDNLIFRAQITALPLLLGAAK